MTTASNPDEITYYQLATLKGALRMEKVGLSHSAMRGKKLRPMWAAKLGLKPRDSYDTFIEAVQARMNTLLDQVQTRASNA